MTLNLIIIINNHFFVLIYIFVPIRQAFFVEIAGYVEKRACFLVGPNDHVPCLTSFIQIELS